MFYVSLLAILALNLILPTITYAAPLQKLIVAGNYGYRNLDRNPMLAVIDSENITLTNFPQIVGSPGKINCNNNESEQMFCAISVNQTLLVTSDNGRHWNAKDFNSDDFSCTGDAENVVCAAIDLSSDSKTYIKTSTDKGTTWQKQIVYDSNDRNILTTLNDVSCTGSRENALSMAVGMRKNVVDRDDPLSYAVYFLSSDGGET